MIHKGESGDWTISTGGVWLPGIYATERAARYAFRFPAQELQALSDRICRYDGEDRPITFEDLRGLRSGIIRASTASPGGDLAV